MNTNKKPVPRPFLKWAGGKTALLPEIITRLPAHQIGHYCEPFLGGGAVFFELSRLGRIDNATLQDVNAELITTYKVVRSCVDELIDRLRDAQRTVFTKEEYLRCREEKPDIDDAVGTAVWMITMNRTCFNGLWRTNAVGKFNTAWGARPHVTLLDEPNLRACSSALQRARLIQQRFEGAFEDLVETLYYCDPPYVPRDDTSFVAYAKQGFSHHDHVALATLLRDAKANGHTVMAHNIDCEFVRALYSDFEITSVAGSRRISRDGNRDSVAEVIIC
jgi:DNA adenine methylase